LSDWRHAERQAADFIAWSNAARSPPRDIDGSVRNGRHQLIGSATLQLAAEAPSFAVMFHVVDHGRDVGK
jgi:hypothetical protein